MRSVEKGVNASMTTLFMDLDDLRCSYAECKQVIRGGKIFLNKEEDSPAWTAFHEPCLVRYEQDRRALLVNRVVLGTRVPSSSPLPQNPQLLQWLKDEPRLGQVTLFSDSKDLSETTLDAKFTAVGNHMVLPPGLESGFFKCLTVNTLMLTTSASTWNGLGPAKVLEKLFRYLKVHLSALRSVRVAALVYPAHLDTGASTPHRATVYLVVGHHREQEHHQWLSDERDLVGKYKHLVKLPRAQLLDKMRSVGAYAACIESDHYGISATDTELMPYSTWNIPHNKGRSVMVLNGFQCPQKAGRPSFFLNHTHFDTSYEQSEDPLPLERSTGTRAVQLVDFVNSVTWYEF